MKNSFTSGYRQYDTSKGFGNKRKWQKAFYERMTGKDARMIIDAQADTPYAILEISEHATQQEIKSAFRRLISIWHPDKNPGRLQIAEEMSKKIIAAYTILKT